MKCFRSVWQFVVHSHKCIHLLYLIFTFRYVFAFNLCDMFFVLLYFSNFVQILEKFIGTFLFYTYKKTKKKAMPHLVFFWYHCRICQAHNTMNYGFNITATQEKLLSYFCTKLSYGKCAKMVRSMRLYSIWVHAMWNHSPVYRVTVTDQRWEWGSLRIS